MGFDFYTRMNIRKRGKKRRPRRLYKVALDEVSGVDLPANQEPGWLVMKSADGDAGYNSTLYLRRAVFRCDPDAYPPNVSNAIHVIRKALSNYDEEDFDDQGEIEYDLQDPETRDFVFNLMLDDVKPFAKELLKPDVEFNTLSPIAKAVRKDLEVITKQQTNKNIYKYVNDWMEQNSIPYVVKSEMVTYVDDPSDLTLKLVRKMSRHLLPE